MVTRFIVPKVVGKCPNIGLVKLTNIWSQLCDVNRSHSKWILSCGLPDAPESHIGCLSQLGMLETVVRDVLILF